MQNKEEMHSDPPPQRYRVDDGTMNESGMKGESVQISHTDQTLIHILEKVYKKDKASLNFFCQPSQTDNLKSDKNRPEANLISEWLLCGDIIYRQAILRKSTFSIIIYEADVTSSFNFQLRLSEALREGAIPVVICVNINCDTVQRNHMPFSEVIDYKLAFYCLPSPRLPELHYILRSFPDNDLAKMRSTGRSIWQTYLGSSHTVMLTILNTIRNRLGIPTAPFLTTPSPQVFNSTLRPQIMDPSKMKLKLPNPEEQESLGPIGILFRLLCIGVENINPWIPNLIP